MNDNIYVFIPGLYSTNSSTALVHKELEDTLENQVILFKYDEFLEAVKSSYSFNKLLSFLSCPTDIINQDKRATVAKMALELEANLKKHIYDRYERNFANKKVILLGHSFGGLLSLLIANKFPVSKLVLTAPAVTVGNLKQIGIGLIEKQMGRYDTKMIDTDSGKELDERISKLSGDLKPYLAHFLLFSSMANMSINIANHLNCPTQIYQGTRDPLVRISGSRNLANAIPNSEFIELEGFTHSILKSPDAPELVLKRIKEFITKDINNGHSMSLNKEEY